MSRIPRHNTIDTDMYPYECSGYTLMAVVWYRLLLYKEITVFRVSSPWNFWFYLFPSLLILFIAGYRTQRNEWYIYRSLGVVLGLYTFAAYHADIPNLYVAIGIITSVLFFICILYRVLDIRTRMERGIKWVSFSTLLNLFSILFCACIAAMILAAGFSIKNSFVLHPKESVSRVESSLQQDPLSTNSVDTPVILDEESWSHMSTAKKLDLLNEVLQNEREYLGIPDELSLESRTLSEDLGGKYASKDHTVCIQMEELKNATAHDCVETICHEVFHAYEHAMVDLYNETSTEYKRLPMFNKARIYRDEFAKYVSDDENLHDYYMQQVEIDARRYAAFSVDEYFEEEEN